MQSAQDALQNGDYVMDLKFSKALSATAIAAVFFAAGPVSADVKAGVDAWTNGEYAVAVREWVGPAAAGDPDAQFNMAQAYRLGRGVEADPVQAEALYAKAAAQGHVKAADNYGLLLFQKGAREQALPYIAAAADRGEEEAQYIVGIAHFNGDLVEKDWTRAYALLTLANSSGLPQARSALAQMDEYVSLEDRQSAQTLAAELKASAEAKRARDLAAVDLALAHDTPTGAVVMANAPLPRTTSDANTGADFTLPARSSEATVASSQKSETSPRQAAAASPGSVVLKPERSETSATGTGPWKVQLGAFGVDGNADRLWSRLSTRRELAGSTKMTEPAGRLTVLFAGGFATRAEARAACTALKASGNECLVTR